MDTTKKPRSCKANCEKCFDCPKPDCDFDQYRYNSKEKTKKRREKSGKD